MVEQKEPPPSWEHRRSSIVRRWQVPFIAFEWFCERISYYLSRWAFIDVLDSLAKLSILLALVTYLTSTGQRRQAAADQRKSKHYQAWQTINSALGQPGNGGRTQALEDLSRDDVSLAGVDISGAFLTSLALSDARMQYARMTNVTFISPNFRGTFLWHAIFRDSYFENAMFRGAYLNNATLANTRFLGGADFSHCNLSEAYFWESSIEQVDFSNANLTDAMFMEADLASARLSATDLTRAYFLKANLFKADLELANLDDADFDRAYLCEANFARVFNWTKISNLKGANVYGIQNPPAGFLEWATNKMGAVCIPIESYLAWRASLERPAKL